MPGISEAEKGRAGEDTLVSYDFEAIPGAAAATANNTQTAFHSRDDQ